MSDLTLKGITWDHPRGYTPLLAASRLYQKETGVEILWEKRSLKDFGDQPLEELAKKFDLLIIDHPHSGVVSSSGFALPLDKYIDQKTFAELKSQSAGPSFNSYNYQSHQWALPVDAAFQSACFRSDLLKTPIPSTWDEVFELAGKLKSEGKYVGIALCPTDALCSFLSISTQLKANIAEDKEQFIDEQIGVQTLELLRKIKDVSFEKVLEWNPIQLYDYMAEHDEIVYCPLAFNYTNYSRQGFRKYELVFTNPPGKVALLGGAGIAVSSACQFPADATAFAAWISGGEAQRGVYTENDGQPGNRTAWLDPEANQLTCNFFTNSLETLEKAFVRPRALWWPGLQEQLGDAIHDYLLKEKDPNATIRLLQELYEKSRK